MKIKSILVVLGSVAASGIIGSLVILLVCGNFVNSNVNRDTNRVVSSYDSSYDDTTVHIYRSEICRYCGGEICSHCDKCLKCGREKRYY